LVPNNGRAWWSTAKRNPSARAPTESDRQDAIDAVRAAEWSGGKWIGGITVVKNAMTLAKALSPYEWRRNSETAGGCA